MSVGGDRVYVGGEYDDAEYINMYICAYQPDSVTLMNHLTDTTQVDTSDIRTLSSLLPQVAAVPSASVDTETHGVQSMLGPTANAYDPGVDDGSLVIFKSEKICEKGTYCVDGVQYICRAGRHI